VDERDGGGKGRLNWAACEGEGLKSTSFEFKIYHDINFYNL
jgi:hypothetical protein